MAGSGQRDSVEKIIERYFPAVTLQPFTYKKLKIEPKQLRVSPGIFVKRMTCVANCGACCRRFTLDWLPSEIDNIPEEHMKSIAPREIDFDGRKVVIYSDTQDDHDNYYCKQLNHENGRCMIHTFHPFSCDFELLRFYHFEDQKTPDVLAHRPFGRGWNMKQVVTGEKGALCEWYDSPCEPEWIENLVRRLNRLKDWTDYFGLKTTLPRIIEWIASGPHTKDLFVGPSEKKGFELL